MRNLKKILALVLALVMVVGMMSIATAATPGTGYTDDADIKSFDEAVQVLTQLGIYQGNEKNEFNPNDPITRGEVATLIYRIVHDDVAGKYVGIYADYNKFGDVKSTAWNAGYINYCANGEYILGDGTNFYPNLNVNGYQVLAIMLRALGYDREGEFQGAGWEVRTARKAKELGITKNVVEGTLGAPASRGLVAELIFRSLLCETQKWSLLTSYEGREVTLGYEVFGLTGNWTEGEADATDVEKMANRDDAKSDLDVDGAEYYGEPIAFWYSPEATDMDGTIEIRFNPVATYTNAVPQITVYGLVRSTAAQKVYVDGAAGTDLDLTSAANPAAIVAETGRGVVTDVYVVDGNAFVIIKNTYVDIVDQAYRAVASGKDVELGLTNDTVDYEALKDSLSVTAWDAITSTLAGIAKGSVVIYNMYGDASVADFTTIHVATMKNGTVTDTYVPAADDVVKSYFLVGKTKYVYNENYMGGGIEGLTILEREVLVAAEEENQNIYFDDFGNVIYSVAPPVSSRTGFLLITNSTYGGGNADNGYWNTFRGYDMTGKAVTVKGGVECYYYTTKDEAQDYGMIESIGLYSYTIGEDDRYNLKYIGEPTEVGENGILAGDADALVSGDETDVLDDNTVFVIANYSKKTGLITGYTVKTSIKNIPDLTDGEYVLASTGTEADKEIAFKADWLNLDGDADIDFVFVTGAKQTADKRYTVEDTDVIYLLDTTPVKHFTEYDVFSVIKDGKATTIKAVPEFAGFTAIGLYEITGYEDDYVYSADAVEGVEGGLVAADVMKADDDYVVLADNCKVYDLTSGEMVQLTAEEVAGSLPYVAEYYVASNNGYGFATVIYILAYV